MFLNLKIKQFFKYFIFLIGFLVYAQVTDFTSFKEVFELTDPKALANKDATVVLFEGSQFIKFFDKDKKPLDYYGYALNPIQKHTCDKLPMDEQPTASFCSGVLVAPDVILTASHCLNFKDACKKTKFVFGFENKKEKIGDNSQVRIPVSIPKENIYSCSEILYDGLKDSAYKDVVLIKLTERVEGREPVRWRRSGDIKNDESIYTIGSPIGKPLKFTSGVANVPATPFTGAQASSYVVKGNSGGPVFNSTGHFLEGVHVTGAGTTVLNKETGCLSLQPYDYDKLKGRMAVLRSNMDVPWVAGSGFVPVSYFKEQLERYAKSRASDSGVKIINGGGLDKKVKSIRPSDGVD